VHSEACNQPQVVLSWKNIAPDNGQPAPQGRGKTEQSDNSSQMVICREPSSMRADFCPRLGSMNILDVCLKAALSDSFDVASNG
jgi:hypothetical protein